VAEAAATLVRLKAASSAGGGGSGGGSGGGGAPPLLSSSAAAGARMVCALRARAGARTPHSAAAPPLADPFTAVLAAALLRLPPKNWWALVSNLMLKLVYARNIRVEDVEPYVGGGEEGRAALRALPLAAYVLAAVNRHTAAAEAERRAGGAGGEALTAAVRAEAEAALLTANPGAAARAAAAYAAAAGDGGGENVPPLGGAAAAKRPPPTPSPAKQRGSPRKEEPGCAVA
jgi:hypothetical protein